ncbi:MAG: hypothetical protein ACLU7V_02115 [Anaerovoracaceae bacterium]
MDLKVRNIDDTTAARLKQIAKEKNMYVETLARKILADFAVAPEIRYTEDKYAELLEKMTELYRASMEEAAECIRENNYLMAKLLKENEKDE